MPEMTDREFIDFYKVDVCGVPNMSDDEFIDRRRELEAKVDVGWDTQKYAAAWQDPNRRRKLVSKSELAKMLDISLSTIDAWERKGAPIHTKGNHGIAYQIDFGALWEWQMARSHGVSIEEYRQIVLEDEIRAKERDEARWAIIENKQLIKTVQALTGELASLRREVQTLKRRKTK